jgi:hypothetical protein
MKYTIDYVIRVESDRKPSVGGTLKLETNGIMTPIRIDSVDPRTPTPGNDANPEGFRALCSVIPLPGH